jgi:NlpC/P60 family putative phage cell wall peptidase
MSETDLRALIVAEARTWKGTPYQSQAYPRKGLGCDCATLIAGVAMSVGLVAPDSPIDYYSPDRHLHRSDEEYRRRLAALGFIEIRPAVAQPGDVILFVMGERQPASHSAIVTESENRPNRMLHAYRTVGRVVENRIDPTWWARARFAFRFPGVPHVG